ncbi:MAG: 16S rRNA (adenine(1518)-N(6)/adenine(1519)-N(6))-dimethyltransferase RsmA [Thiohalocapsa sp.]|nr:16S rRNA (adenine(1518)-N(6)/adenine(1519)-N(6))-dimethyltransferase RsmA [Thiohalocapsa sp.]MCF7991037.1 16S rRNA (adenine(1518)-N(6)/adenine(1519)-N(6))-dimethyltransferase RsmA [Thiohalocapsa sp.]
MSEHRARKRFGQNFLHDPGTIRRILGAVDPRPGQHLVEIGPGRGALTEGLLEGAGALDVIELDRDLVGPLQQRLGGSGDLRVHNADALHFDLCGLVSPDQRLRLVGNLPYNISTPLLFRFLDQSGCIADLHLMLQKEVVDRICADPGNKTYGRLSVMVQTVCSTQRLFVIGPGAFSPAPKVDSAMLRLTPDDPPRYRLRDTALHARVVAAAFSQRRKTLRNSLSGLIDPQLIRAAGLDPAARAEQLGVDDFVSLANHAAAQGTRERL